MKTKATRRSERVHGERLSALQRQRSWSQQRLAKELGVSPRTVQGWLANGRASLEGLHKAAAVLGVRPHTLMLNPPASLGGARKSRVVSHAPVARSFSVDQWLRLKVREIHAFDLLGSGNHRPDAIRKAFHELWWPESDRGWVSTISDNSYRWTNEQRGPDDRRWIQFMHPDAHLTDAPVSVEIMVEDGVASYGAGAGLLYRYQAGKVRYYSFLLTPDEQLRFAFTDRDGEKTLYKSRSDAVRTAGFNKLGIASRGDEFFLFVNDQHVRTIVDEELSSGGVAIVASGVGRFAFRNVTIYAEP